MKFSRDLFDFTVIFKTLAFVWESSKKHTIIRLILVVLLAIIPLIPLYFFKLIIDAFASGEPVTYENILWILLVYGGIQLLIIFLNNIASYNNLVQSDIVTDYMSEIMINKSLEIDLEYFDSDKYHDQFHRAIGQGGSKPLSILGLFTTFLQGIVTLIAVMAALFTLHWSVVIILFFIVLPVAIIQFYYSEKIVVLQEKQTQKTRVAGYYRSVLTGGTYAKEVRVFSYGETLLQKFLVIARELRLERLELYWAQTKSVGLAKAAEAIAVVAALSFIVHRAIVGDLTVGDITLYFGLFQRGKSSMNSIMLTGVGLHQNKLLLNFLFEFLDMKKKVLDPPKSVPVPDKINTVTIKDLSFIYPGTNKVVLENINLEFKKGEIIAIVGENGSGKTTLVKLINRLYDATSGGIYFNGILNTNFKVRNLRNKITIIFQKFATYAFSVADNIAISDVHHKINLPKVKESSHYAQSDEFIQNLPEDYQTQLGRAFKGGQELSGGQWQKIALSRAFYKDAEIIILDEPTSHIDPIAEDKIFQNLKNVAKDSILILITHRIYNLRMADKVVVLDKGKMVEFGSHHELIAADGLYKEMFDKQDADQ